MAYPHDDHEGFGPGEERGERERERWRHESWERPGERYASGSEWRRGGDDPWRAGGRHETWRGGERPWRAGEGRRSEPWRGGDEPWRGGDDPWRGGERYGRERWRDEQGYGGEWEDRYRAGGSRDDYSRPPGERDRRAARDALQGGDLGWHGGVRGAEGGGGYGGGMFGTAYSLYAGRPEHIPEGQTRAGWGTGERPIGRGPKGYRRSDERIHDEVCERIARSGVNADEVEVRVENGEVTLSGTVDRREDKWHLETLADGVFGVEEVHDQLRTTRRGDFTPRTH